MKTHLKIIGLFILSTIPIYIIIHLLCKFFGINYEAWYIRFISGAVICVVYTFLADYIRKREHRKINNIPRGRNVCEIDPYGEENWEE